MLKIERSWRDMYKLWNLTGGYLASNKGNHENLKIPSDLKRGRLYMRADWTKQGRRIKQVGSPKARAGLGWAGPGEVLGYSSEERFDKIAYPATWLLALHKLDSHVAGCFCLCDIQFSNLKKCSTIRMLDMMIIHSSRTYFSLIKRDYLSITMPETHK